MVMSEQNNRRWETHVQRLAADFVYPATPPLGDGVARGLTKKPVARRLPLRPLWAFLLICALLFATAWGIPTVRAVLLEWLEIGAVRIWLIDAPTPTPAASGSMAPAIHPTVPVTAPVTSPAKRAMPAMSPTATAPMRLDFAGETTLAEAQIEVAFPLLLPAHPPDLGAPDRIYLQRAEGDTVILVWLQQPGQSERVRMSLHLLGPGAFLWKMQPREVIEATVDGNRAVWTQGPYYIQVADSGGTLWANRRLVEGHVLIWTDGEMTYRLESDLSMAEAIRVAESLGEE